MEEDFRAILLAASSITDRTGTRINFGASPQGTALPAIVLNTIDDGTGYTHAGSDLLYQGRVQLDCYGETYAAAKLLSRAVLAVLTGYIGGNFTGIFLDAARDSREGGSNEVARPSRVSMDFITNWSE